MKTRFSSLVNFKKNIVQRSEQAVQQANNDINSAKDALELSYKVLQEIPAPQNGTMGEMLANRALLSSSRGAIEHNKNWINFASNQLEQAKEKLKLDMIEHEKYQYLELQEIKEIIKKRKVAEAKELDEVALMTYDKKDKK